MQKEADLARKFYQIGRLEVVYINKHLAQHQLRMEHVQLLHYVALHPGCSQKEAAKYLQYQPASLTHLLKKLETRDMIKREVDPQNRLQKKIFLQQAGQKVLTDIDSRFTALNQLIQKVDLTSPNAFQRVINQLHQVV